MAAGMSPMPNDREVVRTALERVCSGADFGRASDCYAEDFVDHVNRLEFRGLEGVRRSTALYQTLFDDLRIEVVDQVAEAGTVASRWVMRGSNRGREVKLTGITLSRLRDGRIVEDWSATDGLDLVRGLGVVRALLAAPLLLRAQRE
jgi:ketosteroid isomerase-like protein